MSGHKSFKALREKVVEDPKRRARVENFGRAYDAILELADLREALGVTQTDLAELLDVSQPNVSKIEHKDDLYLSTLKSYVSALGGRLELKAVFPDRSVNLALPGESRNQDQQRRSFEALTDNFLSFQRRNTEFAQGWAGWFLKLQESSAKAAESNARAAEVVARSASEQQESFRKLAEQMGSTYEGLFSSWDRYAKENLRRAEQVTGQVAEQVTEQIVARGIEAAEQVSRQGLRVAEHAAEQTERAARKADPNDLPIENYDRLNASEVSSRLEALSAAELRKVEAYEKRNKNRDTVMEQIERRIKAAS